MARRSLSEWYVIAELIDRMHAAGATEAEVAELLGYSTQTIVNWRKGSGQPSVGDVREFFAHFGNGDEEAMLYMQQVVRNKKADLKIMEADPRFNMLMLGKGELHYRYLFKWWPGIFPGIVQTRSFHFDVLQPLDGNSDEVAERSWDFKQRRAKGIRSRADDYELAIIIGASAFLWLSALTPSSRRQQLDHLKECNTWPGWDIRVMAGPNTLGSGYELFLPDGKTTAGPGFVYTEVRDRSWCVEESKRVKLYHEPIKPNWARATPLEEFLDAERDRLA